MLFRPARALALCALALPVTRAAAQPRPAAPNTPAAVAHAPWTRRATIYEVNVRQYTPEGTLAALLPHLPRLKALGADILWVMPVQPIGVKNRKGTLGSYYSVRDYRAINPEFGTRADWLRFADAAHRQGQKVILDWVPNHTAFDHPWIAQHPDWYVHRPDGSIMNARDNDDKETDWTDVAELNYDNRDLRRAMIADMRFWLDSMRVDGFRCDVAGGVPEDFWREARAALGAGHPGLFLLAEAEGPKYYDAFDMTYGWSLWDLLVDVAKGRKAMASLDDFFARSDTTYPADAYRMFFTTNHDKNSWDGTEFELFGANAQAAYVLAATAARGMPLLYSGQEASNRKRLRFFERDTIDWRGPSLAPFYTRVFQLRHAQAALENGSAGGPQVRIATAGSDEVYAFSRTRGANTVVVAVNFGAGPAQLTYRGLAQPGTYTDWFRGGQTLLGASGELEVPAHGYRVFVKGR